MSILNQPGPAGADLSALTDDELRRRWRSVDPDFDADHDPAARAADVDRLMLEAARRFPENPVVWFERGLYAKWRSDWPAAVEYNRRALELLPSSERREDPAAWNLGIAATALHDWATARWAWTAYGIGLPAATQENEPVIGDFGPAPVRLNPTARFVGQQLLVLDGLTWQTEVVWGRRLCPTRIQIANVPMPESGHRFGDIVLHDGDPVGTRRNGDRELGVFNEISLWERSPLPTLTAALDAPDAGAVEELTQLFDSEAGAAEDWTHSVRMLCGSCSEGSPDHEHHHGDDRDDHWSRSRRMGLAADPDQAEALLDRWVSTGADRSYTELEVVLR